VKEHSRPIPSYQKVKLSPRLPEFQLLRDTFAGKKFATFQNQFPNSKFLSNFYRQKCRAAAEILCVYIHTKSTILYDNYDAHAPFRVLSSLRRDLWCGSDDCTDDGTTSRPVDLPKLLPKRRLHRKSTPNHYSQSKHLLV